jgi:hypothetical protein
MDDLHKVDSNYVKLKNLKDMQKKLRISAKERHFVSYDSKLCDVVLVMWWQ